MAGAFDRRLGENTVAAAAWTLASVSLTAGEFLVIWVAADNTGSNLPTISSVVHNGVTQTHAVAASHGSSSATAAAATVGYIIVVASVTNTVSGTLTVNFSANPAKAVGIAAVFTGLTTTALKTAGTTTSTNMAGSPAATTTGAGAGDGMALALASCENTSAMTWSEAFNTPGGDGDVVTAGGGAAANVALRAGYLALTAVASGSQITATAVSGANDGGVCVACLTLAPIPSAPRPNDQRTRRLRANLVR